MVQISLQNSAGKVVSYAWVPRNPPPLGTNGSHISVCCCLWQGEFIEQKLVQRSPNLHNNGGHPGLLRYASYGSFQCRKFIIFKVSFH